MNIGTLVSLLATIAYIPLLILLVANRPWQRRQRLFAAFLVGMMIWSLGTFLFRSEFFMNDKLWLAKITLCFLALSIAPLHYFLRTYYENAKPGFPLAFVFSIISIVFVLLFLPQTVIIDNGVLPIYGLWLYPVMLFNFFLLARDAFLLTRKLSHLSDPIARNQIIYLIFGLGVALILSLTTAIEIGRVYPMAQVGNCILAFILTYTVIRHRLLDLRLIARRGLTLLLMAIVGVGIYLMLFAIAHVLFNIEVAPLNLALGMGIALIITLVILQIRSFTSSQIDKLFYRESYSYRQQLNTLVRDRIRRLISLDELGSELLTLLSGALRCKKAFLLLPQEDGSDFFVRFALPPLSNGASFTVKKDSPLLEWLAKENTFLPRETLEIAPEFKSLWSEEKDTIKRLNIHLFLPIISRGKTIGLMMLGERVDKHRYTLEDINLAERVIRDIATSLEKEYLQDQLRKREQELSLINQLAAVISSSLNIHDVYDAFADELQEVVEADYTAICLIEENEIYFAAVSSEVGSAWNTGQKIPLAGTTAEWVFLNKRSFYERDLSQSRRFWTGEDHAKHGIKSMLYLPLVNKGEVIGVLLVGSKKAAAYSPEQTILLEHLASQIAAPIENSRLFTKSEEIARIDGITELFNRRHFDERMREEIDRHSRYGDILSILLIDLDNFKKYNDTFGHLAGDRLLVQAAEIIKSSIRSSDQAFRYGGDEFAVILPHSSTMDSFSVAERMRERIAEAMAARQLDISVSIGVASWPGDGTTLDELCYSADMALYYAKRTGQNRTSIASRTLFSLNEPSVNVNSEAEVLSTIYALAATLEARDKFTYGHSRRVSRYAVAVAEKLNLTPAQVTLVSAAALLHDIGKIGIPDSVLNKREKLLDEEWELLKQHPRLSATIVGHVPSLSACLAAVKHHHERWDGMGYPSGLKGEAIPIEARILCVTDAFEAMISERPYRSALTFKQAIAELEKCAGTQFDPHIVKTFIPVVLSTAPDDIELELQRVRHEPD
ncbi:MAG: diguanylate cyclase [Dehalococcoidia bacterium]|nr:diguanylate cyclase [Dehalococcoidia bacterium]